MVFPVNAVNQMTAFNPSRTGTSQAGETNLRSGVKRRCKSCAIMIRNNNKKTAANRGQNDLEVSAEVTSHSPGHNDALDRMLKKYGRG